MAINIPKACFRYQGKKYRFTASLSDTDDNMLGLDPSHVKEFEYVNELNKLCLVGSLVFEDVEGKVANYINKRYVDMLIRIAELDQKSDTVFTIEKEKTDSIFQHVFIVNSIDVLGREDAVITYKFNLVSQNYYNLVANIQHSTYSSKDGPQPILKILQDCLMLDNEKTIQLSCDADSFKNSTDNVKIDYITQCNDNKFSAFKYLMDKLFYYDEKDNEFKFMYYDEYSNLYKILNLAKLNTTCQGVADNIVISMFKTKEELYTYQNACDIGTVSKFPKTSSFKTTFDKQNSEYSYDKNKIITKTNDQDELNIYANSYYDQTTEKQSLFQKMPYDGNYMQVGSLWNNDFSTYSDICNMLLNDNALIIEIDGSMKRQPADVVFLMIPPDPTNQTTDADIQYKDLKSRYSQLQGEWIIGKVRHSMSPEQETYRQNLILFRNHLNPIEVKSK